MVAQFRRLTWKASLLATVVSMLAFTIALAASGDLDSTFDGDGLVTSFVVPANPGRNDFLRRLSIQPADGKIVAAGTSSVGSTATQDFGVIRYNTDGSLDTTFSGDGRLLTNFGGVDQGYGIIAQGNGKIVVTGQKCDATSGLCDLALARYTTNGTLDATFSGDGKQTTDFGGDDNGSFGGVVIAPNGKINVAGYMWNGADYDLAVYRYNANGSLDTTFSADGRVNIDFAGGRNDFPYDLARQSDGKIVIAGYTCDATACDFAVARLNLGGALDTTFSADGKQSTDFGADDLAFGMALQDDGKIVLVGGKYTAPLNYFAVARYNTNGSLDTTFNGTGKKIYTIIAAKDAVASDVIVQSDGKIVVFGETANGVTNDFALVRLKAGGALDTTLSSDGKVTVDFGADEFAWSLALQGDGKYVLGGYTRDSTQRDFALARVLP